MKPEYFRRLASFSVCIFIAILFSAWQLKPKGEFYQLTVYHYTTVQQEQLLDNYLQQALLPALHRNGVSKIGVLKAIANDTSVLKTLYVVMPLKNLESITTIQGKLADDADYQAAGSAYINAVYTSPAYDRMETILLKAFPMAPPLQIPQLKAPRNERVYELRSYESASEKIFKSKVHMFNEGDEIGIFTKLNFNAIFYSTVIAGGKMPNLCI